MKKSEIIRWLFGVDNLLFKPAEACLFLGEIKPAELEVRLVDEPDEDNLASLRDDEEEILLSCVRVTGSLEPVTRGKSVPVSMILLSLTETAV